MAKKVVHLMMSHIVFYPCGPGRDSMLGSMFGDNFKAAGDACFFGMDMISMILQI